MPLIRDLIAMPERVHQGDFVLQVTKGVAEPEQTLRDYVVTPQLVDAFDNALGFIQQAVQTAESAVECHQHSSRSSIRATRMVTHERILLYHEPSR